jgi:hypothetical protein
MISFTTKNYIFSDGILSFPLDKRHRFGSKCPHDLSESRRAASDTFLPRYIRDDSARAHVKHKRERYAQNRNNQHGLLKASGAESFRDRG